MREKRVAIVYADGSMQVCPSTLPRNEKFEEIFEQARFDNERETDPSKLARVKWVTIEVGEDVPGEITESNVTSIR